MRRLHNSLFFALVTVLGVAGCSSLEPSVTFQSNTGDVSLNVSSISSGFAGSLPTTSGPNGLELQSICCNSSSCPSSPGCPSDVTAGGYTIQFQCQASLCDPVPFYVDGTAASVDFSALSSTYLKVLSHVELKAADYQITQNSLNFAMEPIEIYWGSAGATAWNSAGTHLLGTVPMISAMQTGQGSIALDSAGNAALTSYLAGTSKQVKLFYRTRLDLAPGEPIPGGSVTVRMIFTIKATGSLR